MESIPVSLIRQYLFCPRIPFFNEVRGIRNMITPWTHRGIEVHEVENLKIQRRSFGFLGVGEPESIERNLRLSSHSIKYHGIADAILIWKNFIGVLDFKTQIDKRANWKRNGAELQVSLYGLLAEERYQKECRYLILSLVKSRSQKMRYHVSEFGTDRRTFIKNKAEELRSILSQYELPHSSATQQKCIQCEYLNFCNDRNL